MEWQPIETAERIKDESILGWVEGVATTIYWRELRYDEERGYWALAVGQIHGSDECYPTHWMSAPDPPKG